MISEKLHDQIEKEGLKKGFKFGNSGGEYDEDGNFIFVIRLLPTGYRLSIVNNNDQLSSAGYRLRNASG